MKKLVFGLAVAAAVPAHATLVVSGDGNIITALIGANLPPFGTYVAPDPGNQQLFRNLLNGTTKAVIRNSLIGFGSSAGIAQFYADNGVATTLIDKNAPIAASDLASTRLYIDLVPAQAYTPSEVTAISNFLQGGGKYLVSGEFAPFFSANNGFVNSLLIGIGSDIRIVDDSLSPFQFSSALTVGSGPLVAGVPSVSFLYGSNVTGGTPMFSYSGKTIVAMAEFGGGTPTTPTVPEPASWAMLIAGFGLTGAALRRRRAAIAV